MNLSYILKLSLYRQSCLAQGELSFDIHIEGWSKGDLTFTFSWLPQEASGSDGPRGKVAPVDEICCYMSFVGWSMNRHGVSSTSQSVCRVKVGLKNGLPFWTQGLGIPQGRLK